MFLLKKYRERSYCAWFLKEALFVVKHSQYVHSVFRFYDVYLILGIWVGH